jgi:uncharacterized membrane protein
MILKQISLYVMAALYIFAGINHFRMPKFYYNITPPYLLKFKKEINIISGWAEIILGIGLLIPAVSSYAAWGIIALLIAVYPANIYHLQAKGAGMKVPIWGLWVRLAFQFVLIAWAYWHTY